MLRQLGWMGSYEIVNNPQQSSALPHQATPIATTPSQHLPQSFFARPAEEVAPELIGCLLVKRQAKGSRHRKGIL